MLTAGLSVGANTTNYACIWRPAIYYNDRRNYEIEIEVYEENGESLYGWPFAGLHLLTDPDEKNDWREYRWDMNCVAIDSAIWLTVLSVVVVGCEFLICRREVRRQ